jgi:Ca2+-transporting ATPase
MMSSNAYQSSSEQVVESLQTHAARGLNAAEARARLVRDGKNELVAAQPTPAWKKFLAQLRDPLVLLLLVATAISAALWLHEHGSGLPYEALVILCVVLFNAVLGYLQGARAERALAALRQLAAAHARVIRDGELQSIPAAELVCGDLISVESGDTIPADAR